MTDIFIENITYRYVYVGVLLNASFWCTPCYSPENYTDESAFYFLPRVTFLRSLISCYSWIHFVGYSTPSYLSQQAEAR